MNIIYLLFHGLSPYSGISKKILHQVKGFEACGHRVSLCTYSVADNGHRVRMINNEIIEDYGTGKPAAAKRRVSPEKIITVCIMAYFGIAVYAYWLDTQFDFWMLAVLVGMFQGTIQALSRSYFAKIIPAEKSGEYFGIYDICGKGASVIGTALVSFISQMTGSINIAVSALSVMFLVGLVLFRYSAKLNSVR